MGSWMQCLQKLQEVTWVPGAPATGGDELGNTLGPESRTRQEQLPRLTPRRASFPVLVFYVHMCVDVSTCHVCGVMCRVTSGRGEQKALSPSLQQSLSCSLNPATDSGSGKNECWITTQQMEDILWPTETSAQAPTASETCNLKMQASCEYK